jgi:hypothetical protein
MPVMTDPIEALVLFQQALRAGVLEPQPGELDPQLFAHLDHPNGARAVHSVSRAKLLRRL